MKIIVAQSTAGALGALAGYAAALCDLLASKGHKTQRLDLPSIAAPGRALSNVVSLRLLGTATADALICLDPVAAVLRHPRKLVWLLDDSYLDGDQAQLPDQRAFEGGYLANVLRSSLGEARAIFSPSLGSLAKLHALSFEKAQLLRPDGPTSPVHHGPNPKSETLASNSQEQRKPLKILTAGMAAWSERLRARSTDAPLPEEPLETTPTTDWSPLLKALAE